MATQNPIDYEGTYPLPEAQLDRFIMKLSLGYPNELDELEMLNRTDQQHPIDQLVPIMDRSQLIEIQQFIDNIYVDETVKHYIVQLVSETRENEYVQLGVSPRGSIALMKATKAYAFIQNRDYVIPDDILFLAPYVLAHRIILRPEARYDGITQQNLITQLLKKNRCAN